MRRSPRLASASFAVLLSCTAIACSSSSPGSENGTGGAVSSSGGVTGTGGAVSSTGGATGSGGAVSSSGGATSATGGRTESGGVVGSGGAVSTGGATASTGGAPSASGGSSAGGSSVGGSGNGGRVGAGGTTVPTGGAGGKAAGSGGAGGSGGGARTVKPSAGCSRGSTQVTIANSLISMPTGYNGKDPVPAVIAFHAAGNDNTSMQRNFQGSDLAKKYFMVYPNSGSPSSGWQLSRDKARYMETQAALLSQACVDENRIFGTGHSSGAQMVAQLLCSGDADFDGVAPVASSVYCTKWKNGPIPSLIIHGVMDSERAAYGLNDGNGMKDLQVYLTSNMCTMTSTPFDPVLTNCSNVKTGIDGKPFNDGCVEFQGCSAPTKWCNHNDPQYGTSNHGIPCFGVRAIYDFFESL